MNDEMNLAMLIATHKGSRSYDRLALDSGGAMTAQRFHQLVSKPLSNFPEPKTLTAVARALNVPIREVILAAARSVGMTVPAGYDKGALTLAGVAELPDDAREAIANVARSMVKMHTAAQTQRAGEGSGQQPAATNPAPVTGPDPEVVAALRAAGLSDKYAEAYAPPAGGDVDDPPAPAQPRRGRKLRGA